MIRVQAIPKTNPGGVQGAWFREVYQSEIGPPFMSQLPMAKPPKFRIKKSKVLRNCFIP